MINHSIISERSQDHWPYFEVEGENVLDLGCGRHQTYQKQDHSPCYFLDQGANKVVAVDASPIEVDYYMGLYDANDPTFYIERNEITESKQILDYIQKYDITAIKCDIEGYETCFYDITKKDLDNVKSIAIEYHCNDRREAIVKKLEEWQFNITAEGVFTYCHAPNMGVLFAKK
jgi:hypothetical protein